MDFFSKLGETISATGKDVSQKAKELTGLAKLNMDVRAKEDYVLNKYTDIGKQYYQLHKDDVDPLFEEVRQVSEALKEIERLKENIAELKGLKKCPVCGEVMEMEAVYCKQCGAKYDSIFEEEDVKFQPREEASADAADTKSQASCGDAPDTGEDCEGRSMDTEASFRASDKDKEAE